jgi:hypothetical protein
MEQAPNTHSRRRVQTHSAWERRISFVSTALLVLVFGAFSWTLTESGRLDPAPDAFDYAYGAEALLHGQYSVDWDGATRLPRYAPGTSVLMTPLVAVGGVGAATRLGALSGVLVGLLVAVVAWHLMRPAVAPLAVVLVLATPAALNMAARAMSDLPTAALLILEAGLLMPRQACGLVAAGIVGGYLVWMRPASVVLLGAGVVALSAFPMWRQSTATYVAGAAPLLAALAAWQWMTFGSPLVTGYQSTGASPDDSGSLSSLFSLAYLFGQPWRTDGAWANGLMADRHVPNVPAYVLGLTSVDGFLILPGVGLVGLLGLIVLASQHGARGALGRFGLTAGALLLSMYSLYFYQSLRFVLPVVPFLALGAGWSLMHSGKGWQGVLASCRAVRGRIGQAILQCQAFVQRA